MSIITECVSCFIMCIWKLKRKFRFRFIFLSIEFSLQHFDVAAKIVFQASFVLSQKSIYGM